jgi:hypothetical protein
MVDPSFINTCSAIMVFNLALAHHRRGCQLSLNNVLMTPNRQHILPSASTLQQCMHNAALLYSMAWSLMKDTVHLSAFAFTNFTIRMAAANNLTQIHQQRCDYTRASKSMAEVNATIRMGGRHRSLIEPKVLQGILLNTLVGTKPPVAAGAA